jgi:hypothetical protein
MNSIITRVISNPHSKTSVICYPNGMKPFVISKSKAKALKPGKLYLVDLKASTNGFVYAVKVHGELTIKKSK